MKQRKRKLKRTRLVHDKLKEALSQVPFQGLSTAAKMTINALFPPPVGTEVSEQDLRETKLGKFYKVTNPFGKKEAWCDLPTSSWTKTDDEHWTRIN